NPAPTTFEHAVDERSGDVEYRIEIDAQDGIPIGVTQLAERGIARGSGVVDQNVDSMTVCMNAFGQFLAGGMVGHIRAVGGEIVTVAFVRFQPKANAGIVWRVGDEHVMTGIV